MLRRLLVLIGTITLMTALATASSSPALADPGMSLCHVYITPLNRCGVP